MNKRQFHIYIVKIRPRTADCWHRLGWKPKESALSSAIHSPSLAFVFPFFFFSRQQMMMLNYHRSSRTALFFFFSSYGIDCCSGLGFFYVFKCEVWPEVKELQPSFLVPEVLLKQKSAGSEFVESFCVNLQIQKVGKKRKNKGGWCKWFNDKLTPNDITDKNCLSALSYKWVFFLLQSWVLMAFPFLSIKFNLYFHFLSFLQPLIPLKVKVLPLIPG